MIRTTVILIFCVLLLLPAQGNAEQGIVQVKKEKYWNIRMDTGFTYFFGTVDLLQFLLMTDISHTSELFEFSFSNRLWYGYSDQRRQVNYGQEVLKFDYLPHATWSPFIFAGHSYDEFRKIRYRLESGLGAKYTFIRNKKYNISFSEAFLYEYESHRSRGITEIGRSSERLKLVVKVNDTVDIFFILFHQPNFLDFWNDYRIIHEFLVSVTLTSRLSLRINFDFEYNNSPGPGVLRKYGMQATKLSIKL